MKNAPGGMTMIVQRVISAGSTGIPKTLPGLDCFYMAGQWVEPGGGLPTVAVSGRNVVQAICERDRRRFVTSEV